MGGYSRFMLAAAAALCAVFAVSSGVRAQGEFEAACTGAATQDQVRRFCNLVGQAIYITQPRFGVAYVGGNPVPGTASTLGRRFGIAPRVSGSGRITVVHAELPAIRERGETLTMLVPTVNGDASIGILSGLSILPTVGGFGSVDLLASGGLLRMPSSDGFDGGFPLSIAGGVRFGILRESFTAPGISVTAMYRTVNNLKFGRESLEAPDSAYFKIEGMKVLSLRGTLSKRFLFLGATVGAGYDRFRSDVDLRVRAGGVTTPMLTVTDFTNNRSNVFANVSWTLLIISAVAEFGWQSSGDVSTAPIPAGTADLTGKGTYFGSLALRVAI